MSFESKPLLVDIAAAPGESTNLEETGEFGLSQAREFDFSKEKKIERTYFIGVVLAFWLVFSMWCLWTAFLEYITLSQGQYPNLRSIFINLGTVTGCLLVLVFLRYGVGPVLGPISRSVFSLVLVFFAICFWETLESIIAVAVKDNLRTEAFVYLAMLLLGLLVTVIYEYITHYDVIGNHLLL